MAKPPCRICAKMRQQAALARAQGLPMMNPNISPHMLPQISCHPPYPAHLHPPVMKMSPANMPNFGPAFGPMMMPMSMNGFGCITKQARPSTQKTGNQTPGPALPQQQTNTRESSQSAASSVPNSAKSKPAAAPSSSFKPPASLIQPNYRKPSPNLIVDVAETCQEKFPFEEVAKRHNTTVDKVVEIFAAIIQVPLLRSTTDRRRPGRLATSRVKDYTKAKRDIQEARSEGHGGGNKVPAITPLDIAQSMGLTELPDGFTLPFN
ncbi:uncharacterized protein BCR38DRAFT_432141 [Pseudomassariella vexata]|uniref:Uncharacterized protein n=1 Tax=Pseudomassariella vexata TaxID=1141098 RepID=A0A1Y2E0Y2_9PEZI|nr:uncharacterized protein BCR38DRAFT_432141 [Pseudomassariella vexata]ORY65213.1 hypothetical protein BCR38DRAFT_432141 [Pseudomassariella vexata]